MFWDMTPAEFKRVRYAFSLLVYMAANVMTLMMLPYNFWAGVSGVTSLQSLPSSTFILTFISIVFLVCSQRIVFNNPTTHREFRYSWYFNAVRLLRSASFL